MPDEQLTTAPVVRVQMLIRRPVQEAFEAFEWTFGSPEATATLHVREIDTADRIVIDWDQPTTRVEWRFASRPDDSTLVSITETGFSGTPDDMVAHAVDSTGGFTQVLCALKALLEHDLELNLVRDHLEAMRS